MKQRARRRKFERKQIVAKLKKDRQMQKIKVSYRFDKLKRKIDRKNVRDKNKIVTMSPSTQIVSPQKIV